MYIDAFSCCFFGLYFWKMAKKNFDLCGAPFFQFFGRLTAKKRQKGTALHVNSRTIIVLWVIISLKWSMNLFYRLLLISKMTLETTRELNQAPIAPIFWNFLNPFQNFIKLVWKDQFQISFFSISSVFYGDFEFGP